jgi:hypothetical protein
MQIEEKDIARLSMEVRRFLQAADVMSRLTVMPTLYLEFPHVGLMHHAHASILRAMHPNFVTNPHRGASEFIDDHTIRLIPVAGVVIVLSCKQRFETKMHGSVGYRDVAFETVEQPKRY